MSDHIRSQMVPRGAAGSFILLLAFWLVGFVAPCRAGAPIASLIEVSDITPGSFSVSWQSTEPASASLSLFSADCSTPLPNPLLVSEGHDLSGSVRVTATGLSADTAYCYQTVTTSKSTSETLLFPLLPQTVRTTKAISRTLLQNGKTIPFANDLLQVPAPHLPSQLLNQAGILITLKMLDGRSAAPLSLLLTADQTQNYFNMNNLFDSVSGQSLNLTGGERVKLTERHGNMGCAAIDRFRMIPPDLETTRGRAFDRCSRTGDIDCNNRINILDILRVAGGVGTSAGSICFNSDLDINADGAVNQSDVDILAGGFDATP